MSASDRADRPALARVAVVVPAYNAANELPGVLDRLARVHPVADTWVIDDGSRDATRAVAEGKGVHVVSHATNQGKGQALLTGFRATAGVDAVVTLDADGQHRPEDLGRLLAALESADLVVGARKRSTAMPPHRRLGNALSAAYLSALAGTPLPDVQSGYRAHRSTVLVALGLAPAASASSAQDRAGNARPAGATEAMAPPAFRSSGYGFESEILIATARLGFTIAHIEIEAVYEGAPSHFHPLREVPRFATLYLELWGDARRWSRHRDALAARARLSGAA